MGRQRQEHRVPGGSCVQGEILQKRGVESGRYSDAWREDIDGWADGRTERRG